MLALRSYAAKDGKLGNPGAAALWKAGGKVGIAGERTLQSQQCICAHDREIPRQPVVID
ncbi:MAG TPA: hypothetical protein VKV15_21685 [Bryobacteraceae bacterium]|nr:hypothetical protein [Bryobacteraceae bacterium]